MAVSEYYLSEKCGPEDGYSRIGKLSWDPFNEAETLEETVGHYRDRHGYYLEAVLADKFYRNRDNLLYWKKHSIRLSGPDCKGLR